MKTKTLISCAVTRSAPLFRRCILLVILCRGSNSFFTDEIKPQNLTDEEMDILRPYIENMLLRLRNKEEMDNPGRLGIGEEIPYQGTGQPHYYVPPPKELGDILFLVWIPSASASAV